MDFPAFTPSTMRSVVMAVSVVQSLMLWCHLPYMKETLVCSERCSVTNTQHGGENTT